jgi:hypothetical protein
MRHFQHHIGDYAAATAHLSVLEDGIYHRLLRRYYETERPLPADIAEVARLIRLKHRHELRLLPRVLKEFFSLSQDGWRQSRADKEINKINGWRKNLGAHSAYSSDQSPIFHLPLPYNHKEEEHDPLPTGRGARARARDPAPPLIPENEHEAQQGMKAKIPKEAAHGQRSKSGTRLPDAWRPSPAERDYAADRGLDPDATADAFCDWWSAANGANAVKRDWAAAFRTWCRHQIERANTARPGAAGARTIHVARGHDAFYERLAHIAARERADQERDGC